MMRKYSRIILSLTKKNSTLFPKGKIRFQSLGLTIVSFVNGRKIFRNYPLSDNEQFDSLATNNSGFNHSILRTSTPSMATEYPKPTQSHTKMKPFLLPARNGSNHSFSTVISLVNDDQISQRLSKQDFSSNSSGFRTLED